MVAKLQSLKQKLDQAKGNTSCRCEPPESLPQHSRDSRGRPSNPAIRRKAREAYDALVTLASAEADHPEPAEAKAFLAN